MTAVAQKTVLTGCLAPIDKDGLEQLIANGKANPKVIKTLKCKTVAEGKFRHANYIRNLAPYIVDEPPGLLGDDTAPNPSEASLAALGSCLAVGLHANAVHRGWIVNKLELELEGDLNITAVWGTGDVSEKPVGFTDVRVKVDMECEGIPKSEIDALVTHVKKWSPVANTFTRPGQSRSQRLRQRTQCNRGARVSWVHWRYRGSQADEASAIGVDRRSGRSDRAQRARTPGSWQSMRARSIPMRCCGVSAKPAHGAAINRRMAQPICAAPFNRSQRSARSAAPPPSWRGARTRWSGTPRIRAIQKLVAKFARRQFAERRDARRHRAFQPDEELFRHREAETEGPQGRGRLHRHAARCPGCRISAPTISSAPSSSARTRPRRHRRCSSPIAPILRSRCSRASRSSRWTAPAPMACSSATSSCRMN